MNLLTPGEQVGDSKLEPQPVEEVISGHHSQVSRRISG